MLEPPPVAPGLEPVTAEGITSVEFNANTGKDDTVDNVQIARDDWRSFDRLPGDERLVSDVTREVVLRMIHPSLVAGQKWHVRAMLGAMLGVHP